MWLCFTLCVIFLKILNIPVKTKNLFAACLSHRGRAVALRRSHLPGRSCWGGRLPRTARWSGSPGLWTSAAGDRSGGRSAACGASTGCPPQSTPPVWGPTRPTACWASGPFACRGWKTAKEVRKSRKICSRAKKIKNVEKVKSQS